MHMKKKFAMVVIALAVFIGATAPVSAVSLCDLSPTTFDLWFDQLIYC